MIPAIVRSRIPQLLAKIGKDRKWLAEKSGMSRQQLSDYINLRFIMHLNKAKLIAELLDVKIDDLYEWEWREE